MSEQEIRARFRCAPAYYLQAKLEKKRALGGCEIADTTDAESRWHAAQTEQVLCQASRPEPADLGVSFSEPESAILAPLARESVDLALPGFEILDAALSESGRLVDAPAQHTNSDAGLTQQAILETAPEDFCTWPFRTAPESELEPQPDAPSEPASELERKLKLVLESELELEVVLKSDPELERTLEPEVRSENVIMADFGHRAPRTVPVVSVVMDRKRPNMVRVVGKGTRLAT